MLGVEFGEIAARRIVAGRLGRQSPKKPRNSISRSLWAKKRSDILLGMAVSRRLESPGALNISWRGKTFSYQVVLITPTVFKRGYEKIPRFKRKKWAPRCKEFKDEEGRC